MTGRMMVRALVGAFATLSPLAMALLATGTPQLAALLGYLAIVAGLLAVLLALADIAGAPRRHPGHLPPRVRRRQPVAAGPFQHNGGRTVSHGKASPL